MGVFPKSRRARRWARAGLIVVLAGAAGLAVLRLPAVQTRLVRWAVADGDGWKLEVGRVSVGPRGGEVKGVGLVMPGLVAQAEPGLEVRVAPGRFLFGGRELHVESARAEAVKVTITPAELGGAGGEAGAGGTGFAGLLDGLKSPLPWVLGVARLGADVTVRDGGEDVATARVKVEGGGVSAGAAGEFAYEVEAASRWLPPGPEAMVRSAGKARVRQGAGNGLAAVELRGDLRLPVYGGVRVPAGEFVVKVEATETGERYEGEVRLGAKGEGVAASFTAEYDRAAAQVTGRAEWAAEPAVWSWAGVEVAAWAKEAVGGTAEFAVGTEGGSVAGRLELGTAAEPGLLVAETKDGRTVRVELRGLPKGWLAAWAGAAGGAVGAGEATATGEWSVEIAGGSGGAGEAGGGGRRVKVDTTRALTAGPVTVDDGAGLTASVEVAAEATAERVAWELKAARVGTWAGMEARLAARGEWRLAGGAGGRLESARAELWQDGRAVVEGELAGPLELGGDGMPGWTAGRELARVAVRGWELGWAERWAGGTKVSGAWTEGGAVVTATEGGGVKLKTETPWRFAGLRVADAAGAEIFAGEALLRPEAERTADGKVSARVGDIAVRDAAGRTLAGEVAGWLDAAGAYAGEVELKAGLPAGVAGPAALGELTVGLKAKARSMAARVGQVEALELVAGNAGGELASLRSQGDGGWFYALRTDGTAVVVSQAPWRLRTAELDLSWFGEYMPEGMAAEGRMEAAEFLVAAEPETLRVRPMRTLAVAGLNVAQAGEAVVRGVDARFYPGLDLRVLHRVAPKFELAWQAEAHATEGRVETPGGRALEFEAALGLAGDLEVVLPSTVDAVARGDLAALKAGLPGMAARWPGAGKFTARVDGALSGKEPVEAWVRVEGVPGVGAADGRVLAPLEVSARGKVDGRARTVDMDVAVRMGEGEGAGDLAFGARLAMEEATLRINSTLRGRSWDAAETLAWGEALGAEAGVVVEKQAVAGESVAAGEARAATPIGSAFWGALRGSFELDVGELRMAPYRVERLRGKVAVEETSLVVDGLGGEMFAGRLGGEFRVDYAEGAAGGDHALQGVLRIEQFDTARAVQAVFENDYGSLDAKVDLRAEVRGRGFRLSDLTERAEAEFAINGKGVARLTHPDARTASTLLVMGGVLTLSPELRALGRLLKKFAEMPVDELRIEGGRAADGTVRLTRVRLASPQARLEGTGEVTAAEGVPLPARELRVGLGLSARDETGVILGRMRLLEKAADAEGFRRLNQPVVVTGQAGRPDAGALYELFARGAAGSRGTWGLIMRKVQREVEKQQAAAKAAEEKAKAEEKRT